MAQMLNIGKKLEDFSSLEIAIQQYQKEENVQFFRGRSRTIARDTHGCQTKNLMNVWQKL